MTGTVSSAKLWSERTGVRGHLTPRARSSESFQTSARPFGRSVRHAALRPNGAKALFAPRDRRSSLKTRLGRCAVTPKPSTTVPGFLGLVQTIVNVDWSLVAKYGPRVTVAPRSPAWRRGLRTGDYIVSIDSKSFDAFHTDPPPPGTPLRIEFFRPRFGVNAVFAEVGSPPKSANGREPALRRAPPALAAARVVKSERPEFVQRFIPRHPGLEHSDVKLLMTLLEIEGPKGIKIRASVLATYMHCGVRTVWRSIDRCQYFGLLRVDSGKTKRTANSYEVCWPSTRARKASNIEASRTAHPVVNSESAKLASELLRVVGIDPGSRYSCDAQTIVAGWLGRGWDASTIRRVVEVRMREMRRRALQLPQTLKYFEREIANIYTIAS
jgi:hypothetical protein